MSNFWWVNQGKSYQWERDLGILWAPNESGGKRLHHWDRMDYVQPGDVVIHYVRGQVRAVSSVLMSARPAANPYQGEAESGWDSAGREISVRIRELDMPLSLSSIPLDLRKTWKGYGQPFDVNGKVTVGYLFELPADAAVWLMREMGLEASADDEFLERPEESIQGDYEPVIVAGPDGEVIVKVRSEHRQLRQHLFGTRTEEACALCGRTLPVNLLVTAHIKQRSQCTADERVDPNVVMAACALGCDAVFERGYVQVSGEGIVEAGPVRVGGEHLQGFIDYLVGRDVVVYSPATRPYFDWHARWHRKRVSN